MRRGRRGKEFYAVSAVRVKFICHPEGPKKAPKVTREALKGVPRRPIAAPKKAPRWLQRASRLPVGILRSERRTRKIHLTPQRPQAGSERPPRSPKRRPKRARRNSQEGPALAQESFEMAHWIFYTVGAMRRKICLPPGKDV